MQFYLPVSLHLNVTSPTVNHLRLSLLSMPLLDVLPCSELKLCTRLFVPAITRLADLSVEAWNVSSLLQEGAYTGHAKKVSPEEFC